MENNIDLQKNEPKLEAPKTKVFNFNPLWWNIDKLGYLVPLSFLILISIIVIIGYFFTPWFKGNNSSDNIRDKALQNIKDYRFGLGTDDIVTIARKRDDKIAGNDNLTSDKTEGGVSATEVMKKLANVDYGIETLVKVYGTDYEDLSKTSTFGKDFKYDPSKSYENYRIVTSKYSKNQVTQNSQIKNYQYSNATTAVAYLGSKYAIRLVYNDENSANYYFDPGLLNDSNNDLWNYITNGNDNFTQLADQSLNGKTYSVYQLDTSKSSKPEDTVSSEVQYTKIKYYVDPKTSLVFRTEMLNSDGAIVSATEVLKYNKVKLNDLEKYNNYKELEDAKIEVKMVKHVEIINANVQKLASLYSQYKMLYVDNTDFISGVYAKDVINKSEYEKLVANKDFDPTYVETTDELYKGLILSYIQGKVSYAIFNNTLTIETIRKNISASGGTPKITDVTLKIAGKDVAAKHYLDINSSADRSTSSSESGKAVTVSYQHSLWFNYEQHNYLVVWYSETDTENNKVYDKYLILDEKKAKEFDAASETKTPEGEGTSTDSPAASGQR